MSEMMGSSIHLHVNVDGKDTIIIVQTMNQAGVADLESGAEIAFTFSGNAVHLFSKEDEKNLEL